MCSGPSPPAKPAVSGKTSVAGGCSTPGKGRSASMALSVGPAGGPCDSATVGGRGGGGGGFGGVAITWFLGGGPVRYLRHYGMSHPTCNRGPAAVKNPRFGRRPWVKYTFPPRG